MDPVNHIGTRGVDYYENTDTEDHIGTNGVEYYHGDAENAFEAEVTRYGERRNGADWHVSRTCSQGE